MYAGEFGHFTRDVVGQTDILQFDERSVFQPEVGIGITLVIGIADAGIEGFGFVGNVVPSFEVGIAQSDKPKSVIRKGSFLYF